MFVSFSNRKNIISSVSIIFHFIQNIRVSYIYERPVDAIISQVLHYYYYCLLAQYMYTHVHVHTQIGMQL